MGKPIKDCTTCGWGMGIDECQAVREAECISGDYCAWRPRTTFRSIGEIAAYIEKIGHAGGCEIKRQDNGLYALRLTRT